jgi:hypothetical protein
MPICARTRAEGDRVRELESSLQQFGEFLLKAQLVKEKAAPYCVRWVRRFLTRPASNEPLADQVRTFCEEVEQVGTYQDWQVRQSAAQSTRHHPHAYGPVTGRELGGRSRPPTRLRPSASM